MSERVSQFLIRLSQDPVMLDEFLNDPAPFLGESCLTVEERDTLRSGDADRIRLLLGDDSPMRWASTTSTEPGPGHPKPGQPGQPGPEQPKPKPPQPKK